jgi:ribonuclease P protein component
VVANVRFGITVSKRQARRAVARNMVKRVLRESARDAAPQLAMAAAGLCAEALFRLKSPLPDASAATWSSLKGQLRREADSLLEQLRAQLRQQRQVLAQSGNGACASVAKSAGAQT